MLDIGWAEMFVIGVVLLVVVGPKDLPRVLYQGGQYVRKARSMARGAYRDVQAMVEEAKEEVDIPSRIEVKSPVSPPLEAKAPAQVDATERSSTTS